MPETKVPMNLRDAFLEDPFFRGSGAEEKAVAERREESMGGLGRSWLLPRRWMIPKLWEEESSMLGGKDTHLLSLQEDDTKMELSLDTAGYKPDELKVQVRDGELSIEGKHEEKSEAGHVMVSRQFSRRYGLPQGAKKEAVMSNLSQDGVMVITVPKEKKIQEVKAGDKIHVEHVKDAGEMNRKVEERKRSREEQRSEVADSLQRRRATSRASSRSRSSNSRESSLPRESMFRDEMLVPMTLRDPFMEDPFFKNTLSTIESSRDDFFKKARESFEESLKQMEQSMSGFSLRDWMAPTSSLESAANLKDNCVIKHVEDDTKLEVHMDTTGYKPDELKVEVEAGMVRVEGKHQEKSEAGQVMVSRQFAKQYGLPQGARPEEVVSSLSKDGVLVVTMPKHLPPKLTTSRAVPIAVK